MRRGAAIAAVLALVGCGGGETRRVAAHRRDGAIVIMAERHLPAASIAPQEFPGRDQSIAITLPDDDGVVPATRCVIVDSDDDLRLADFARVPEPDFAAVTVMRIDGVATTATAPPALARPAAENAATQGWIYHDRAARRVEIHLYREAARGGSPLWINGGYDCR